MTRLALLAAVLALPALAHADDRDAQAHAKADEATALFAKDDFAGAAAKFTEAYELDHDASYLFNVAQAYRHAGDCARAAEYYGRFLTEVPHPPSEDKIRGWYAAQTACAKQRAAAAAAAVTSPGEPATTEPAKVAPTNAEPTTHEPTKPEPIAITESHAPESGGHRGVAFALAGAGVVALGVGGLFAWDAHYLGNQRDALLARCSTTSPCSSALVRDYNDRGSRANLFAISGFVAGGAAIAAGIAVYMLSRSESAPPVAVLPVSGGAVATGAFTF